MSYPQQAVPAGQVPLWCPYYGAPIGEAARRFFKKYATFTGRASRSEYWWWAMISAGVGLVLNIIIFAGATVTDSGAMVPGPGAVIGYILLAIWGLGTLVPSLALAVRRLHDANFSGWMLFLAIIPFLGGLALLVLLVLPPKPEGQRFDVPA